MFQARELAELIASGTQPLQNGSVLKMYSDNEEKRTEWARFWVNKGLLGNVTRINIYFVLTYLVFNLKLLL